MPIKLKIFLIVLNIFTGSFNMQTAYTCFLVDGPKKIIFLGVIGGLFGIYSAWHILCELLIR